MARAPRTNATGGPAADPASLAPFTEFGATGLRNFAGYVTSEEWLKDLQGWKGMRVLREMRDNDPIIGAIFFAIEMLLRGVAFTVDPVDDKSADDIEAADFVNSCLADMEHSWPAFIAEVLTFLLYGWDCHEIVYKKRGGQSKDPIKDSRYDDGMIGWRKFAGRAQETVLHWVFDESGDPTAFIQLLPTGGPLLNVPLAKCLHFRTVPLKNNPQGRSIIRNAYTSWYFKKRIQEIEAIGIERDLAGIPIAWVPARILNKDASADDKAQYEVWKSLVRDTSRNEQEGFVLPLAYDKDKNKIFDLTLLNSSGRRAYDTTKIIDRYDHRIAATVIADFLMLSIGGASMRGSSALSKDKTDMFGAAIISFLDIIAAEFNRKAIPDLLDLNGLEGMCMMVHGDVERADLDKLGTFIQQTASVGALIPDAPLESHLRIEAGLPPPPGEQRSNLNEGGSAEDESDVDPAETISNNPRDAQGQGDNGQASDGVAGPGGRGPARKRRVR